MKFENNWKEKTLENLEEQIWPSINPDEHSFLENTCHSLRKKQLKDFTVEDLRIMIGQSIGLNYLIPIAIDVLKSNILAEGDFYEGDLLKSVLTSKVDYWKSERENWRIVCELFEDSRKALEEFDTSKEIRNGWMDLFNEFKKLK